MKRMVAFLVAVSVLVPFVSSAQITIDLKFGSKGQQVSELQQFLVDQGILVGQPTGNYYTITQKAVKYFQKTVGLPEVGNVGPKTRAEINVRLLTKAPATATAATTTATTTASTPASTPEDAARRAETEQLLKKLAELTGGGKTVNPIPQVYASDTTAFEFDQNWRNAVVNLFCTDRYGGGLSSGSGVIIDPRGIILTNAHVAIDFLFQDWPNPSLSECVVRVGSPAAPAYKASLVYFPAGYVYDTVTAVAGAGDENFVYGKDDYAILVITGPSTEQVKAQTVFPYMPLAYDPPAVNTPVYLLGYASEYASYETLQRNLYQLASPGAVNSLRQIQGSGKIDAIAFNGNIVGQHGSSGGAVVLRGGKLAGLMSFFDKIKGTATSDKVLNAITIGYIARDMEIDTGVPLSTFLSNDPATLVQVFKAGNAVVYQKAFAKFWKSRGVSIPGYYE